MNEIVLVSLCGITLLLFAAAALLYVDDRKIRDMTSKIFTAAGMLFMLLFSLLILMGRAGGYAIRFGSNLHKPFEAYFYANKTDAAFIASTSLIMILTCILSFFYKKDIIDYRANFTKNLLFIGLFLIVISNDIFFYSFALACTLLMVFIMINFDFSNTRIARRSIFYFFITQIAFFVICSGLYVFQTAAGFSDISVYTAAIVGKMELNVIFLLLAVGFTMLTVFFISVIRGYLARFALPGELRFLFLIAVNPVLLYSFIKLSSPILANAGNWVIYVLGASGLFLSIYGLYKIKRNKSEDHFLYSLICQGLVMISFFINALIYVKSIDSIKYIPIGSTMIIIISQVLLFGAFFITNEYFQDSRAAGKFKIVMMSINALAVLNAIVRPILLADNKLTVQYLVALLAGLSALIIIIINFVYWLEFILKKPDKNSFEEIKIN